LNKTFSLWEKFKFDHNKLDDNTKNEITKYKEYFKSLDSKIKKTINEAYNDYIKDNSDSKPNISFNPSNDLTFYKILKKDKIKKIDVEIIRTYAKIKCNNDIEYNKFEEIVSSKLYDEFKNIKDIDMRPGIISYEDKKDYFEILFSYSIKVNPKILQ
jgi:hypothetical protein